MLKKLCTSIAVSGFEKALLDTIKEEIEETKFKVSTDSIGNLICYKKGLNQNANRILVTAHIDEVGMLVTDVSNPMKIKFKAIGNIRCYNLLHQKIEFENKIEGVILAENSDKIEKYNYENLYVLPLSNEKEIEVGDVFTFKNNFSQNHEIIMSKALDNRIGCYILIKLIKEINFDISRDLFIVFTVQEELGLKGMKVAITHLKPDLNIVIDASPECDSNNIKCGKGVAIKISDSMSVCDRDIIRELKEKAKNCKIDFQLEVSSCGTSEIALVCETGEYAKTAALSIPMREIHTANNIAYTNDIEATYNLLKLYICDNVIKVD